MPAGVPQTFKHLIQWRPYLKVSLPCSDPGGDFAPTRFTITERQGDKSTSKLTYIPLITIIQVKVEEIIITFYFSRFRRKGN